MEVSQKTCLVCKKSFSKPYNESLKNWDQRHKFCSIKCRNLAPRPKETRLKMRLAKLGKPSWNKGKRLTEEHKAKLRGKRGSLKDTTKMMGRRPWNKIGDGITPIHEKIRKSLQYKNWRKMVFEKDNYTCQLCGGRGRNLQADHIKPFAIYSELRFELSNGRTLCVKCHRATKSFGINQWTIAGNRKARNTNAA